MNTESLNCNDIIKRYINLQVVWTVTDMGFEERPFESLFFPNSRNSRLFQGEVSFVGVCVNKFSYPAVTGRGGTVAPTTKAEARETVVVVFFLRAFQLCFY